MLQEGVGVEVVQRLLEERAELEDVRSFSRPIDAIGRLFGRSIACLLDWLDRSIACLLD
jgi:hypothetical protein